MSWGPVGEERNSVFYDMTRREPRLGSPAAACSCGHREAASTRQRLPLASWLAEAAPRGAPDLVVLALLPT